jgi:hypothetical protein
LQPWDEGCVLISITSVSSGDEWILDSTGTRQITSGTPVFIVGAYDFKTPPPWHAPTWLPETVSLPSLTIEH